MTGTNGHPVTFSARMSAAVTDHQRRFKLKVKRGFYPGMAFALSVTMWQQDCQGKDAYLRHVSDHWVTLSPWWGFSFAVLAVLFGLTVKKKRARDDQSLSRRAH